MAWKWWERSAVAADTLGSAGGRQNEEGEEGEKGAAAAHFSFPSAKRFLSCCQRCGACCAFFPVSFPESDLELLPDRRPLTDMSLPLAGGRRVMRGTEAGLPRCAGLQGEVGRRVRCVIYADRPSTCRDFKRSWEDNQGNSLCDRARSVFGLDQFSPY